jgi:formylmethanofuran dehydrogenase subunit E
LKPELPDFDRVVAFHGHACPGLALGYRVAMYVMEHFNHRSEDEELVAIVENDSCAVDAIQVLTGCTFGKGNLIFRDYGKQVYTFIKRPSGEALRIAIHWEPPPESPEETEAWRRYSQGDRSEEVLKLVHSRKAKKLKAVLEAPEDSLFKVQHKVMPLPEAARVYPSVRCTLCGEKVMEPRARLKDSQPVCIPCSGEDKNIL